MGEIREASNKEKPHLQVLSTQENSAPDNCIQGTLLSALPLWDLG